MRRLLLLAATLAALAAASPAQASTEMVVPEVVCGINCDPGGSFYCASWSVGARIVINGINRECTAGRGQWWWAWYGPGFGWFTGYPQVLDCPCYYWRPLI